MRNRVREAPAHLAAIALARSLTICANDQNVELPAPDGKIVIPSFSMVRAEDIAARRAHTNIVVYIHPDNAQPRPTFETPAPIACVYRLGATGERLPDKRCDHESDGITVTGTSGCLTHTVQFTYNPPPPPSNPKPC